MPPTMFLFSSSSTSKSGSRTVGYAAENAELRVYAAATTTAPSEGWSIYGVEILEVAKVVAIFAMAFIIYVALFAGNGTVMMLIGNAVLKASSHGGYVDSGTAAMVGAVGGVFPSILVLPTYAVFPRLEDNCFRYSWLGRTIIQVIVGPITGAIGCSILLRAGHELGGLDVLHATRAGVVGGAIVAVPVAVVVIPTLHAAWVWLGSIENWEAPRSQMMLARMQNHLEARIESGR